MVAISLCACSVLTKWFSGAIFKREEEYIHAHALRCELQLLLFVKKLNFLEQLLHTVAAK
jgi:hypothetical protein